MSKEDPTIEVWKRENKPVRDYSVSLIELESLKPHEETIEGELKHLSRAYNESDRFIRPIIVDKKHKIILDGHHRCAVLKSQGYRLVPSILIDYSDEEEIKLDVWLPLVNIRLQEVISFCKENKWAFRKIDIQSLDDLNREIEQIEERKKGFVLYSLLTKEAVIVEHGEKENILKWVSELPEGHFMYYQGMDELLQAQKEREEWIAIFIWKYEKQDIVEMANQMKILPPKSTRHMLFYHYKDINIKLADLR